MKQRLINETEFGQPNSGGQNTVASSRKSCSEKQDALADAETEVELYADKFTYNTFQISYKLV